MNRGSSVQNGLIDPVTLTFDILTSNAYHFEYILRSLPSLNSLGSFVYELCCGQTDKQTNKQTVSNVLPTPTDIVDIDKEKDRTCRLNDYTLTKSLHTTRICHQL